jgi:flagellin
MNTALERLSSGLRINRGADDPAGLIASESLRAEMKGISQAIDNSERAMNVIATAEGALNEVNSLLLTIQELTVEAANTGALSEEEIAANQLQVDSAIESITRISNTTSFAGLNLLDGSLDYVTSGVDANDITDVTIDSAQFGSQTYIPVTVEVTASAQKASVQFRSSAVASSTTLNIRGNVGVITLSLSAGTSTSAIMQSVNTTSDSTGVSVAYINATHHASGIVFTSSGYGSDEFVQIDSIGGSFNLVNSTGNSVTRDEGQDIQATINGISVAGDGLNMSLQSLGLDVSMTSTEAFNKAGTTSFAITSGGAMFQLGAKVNTNQQVNIGIPSIAASKLGSSLIGYLSDVVGDGPYSLSEDAGQANQIVQAAITQISTLRGRLGAFEKNVLNTNVNSLEVTLENVTSSESDIRDADFAEETSALTRAQILNQAGTSVLKTANSTPQNILSLLQ